MEYVWYLIKKTWKLAKLYLIQSNNLLADVGMGGAPCDGGGAVGAGLDGGPLCDILFLRFIVPFEIFFIPGPEKDNYDL